MKIMQNFLLITLSLTPVSLMATECWHNPTPNPNAVMNKYIKKTVAIKKPLLYFTANELDFEKYVKNQFETFRIYDDLYNVPKLDINNNFTMRINYFPKLSKFKILSWTKSKTDNHFLSTIVIESKNKVNYILTYADFFNLFTEENITGNECTPGPHYFRKVKKNSEEIVDQIEELKRNKGSYKFNQCMAKSNSESKNKELKKLLDKALIAFNLQNEITYSELKEFSKRNKFQICYTVQAKTTEAFLTFRYYFPKILGGDLLE